MMTRNQILRKSTAEYKVNKSQEKIKQLMHHDDINCLSKTKKNGNTLYRQWKYSQDLVMEFVI